MKNQGITNFRGPHSVDYESLHNILWQSIQLLLRYLILEKSGAIPRASPLVCLKILLLFHEIHLFLLKDHVITQKLGCQIYR